MSHFSSISGGVAAAKGFRQSALACGIKNPTATRLDLALIHSDFPCVSAGTFTTNRVQAAPVRLSKRALQNHDFQAIIANSGNANACTGTQGMSDAKAMCQAVAKKLNISASQVGLCSTGVIGLPLPMSRILPRLPELVESLAPERGDDVAAAIITSDTHPKQYAVEYAQEKHTIRIGGCVKGAGMISPCMATMLCFLTTDAKISRELLRKITLETVQTTFNRITIDGDMSTNDTVMVLANGAANAPEILAGSAEEQQFRSAFSAVLLHLAQAIVRDGERVTKFVTVSVRGARNAKDAQLACEAVCKSALVKSSWNGGDPNWGRILHAVGYSGARIREEKIDISLNGLLACSQGLQATTDMEQLRAVAALPEFQIEIHLNQGNFDYTMYSSDLSPEYVDFNRSEYAYWKQARKDGLV